MSRQHLPSTTMALVAVLAIGLCSSPAWAQRAVGVGIGFYIDDGAINGEQQIGPSEPVDQSFDFRADSVFTGAIWMLLPLQDSVRVGGGLRYYGSYGVNEVREDDNNNDDEQEAYVLGTLFEFAARVEWLLPVAGDFDFILGLTIGIPILFPGGNFRDEIDSLQDEDVGVVGLPRIGYTVGPTIGTRYRILERLAARLDFGIRWEEIFLFWTSDEVSGVAVRKDWDAELIRYELHLGLEVHF